MTMLNVGRGPIRRPLRVRRRQSPAKSEANTFYERARDTAWRPGRRPKAGQSRDQNLCHSRGRKPVIRGAAALWPERDVYEGQRMTRTSATSSRRIDETDKTVPTISRALSLREGDVGATGALEERDEGNYPL